MIGNNMFLLSFLPAMTPESLNKYRNFLLRCNKIGAAQLIRKRI
jgi:hypothetical protein